MRSPGRRRTYSSFHLRLGQSRSVWSVGSVGRRTWMLILKFGQVVDVLVDDNVEVVCFVVRGHIGGREAFGHWDRWNVGILRQMAMAIACAGERSGFVRSRI